MKVNTCYCGRLGNAIFRYFAASLICILKNWEYEVNENCDYDVFNDNNFREIYRDMEIVRLGQGVDATGQFDPEAIERTLTDVLEFVVYQLLDRL